MTSGPTGPGRLDDDGGPRQGAETLAFGPGEQEATTVAPPGGEGRRDPAPTDVDAWYTEPDDEQPDDGPTWLRRRWAQWTGLDRERRLVAVLAAVAVVAVVLAVVGLATDEDAPVELPAVESHGLDENQAACFDFARTQTRLAALVGGDVDDADTEDLISPLDDEVEALDGLAARFPEADYRLIAAFAAVADASAAILEAEEVFVIPGAVELRATAVEQAAEACREVADFDVAEMEPAD